MRRLLAVLALGAVVVACSEQATSPQPRTPAIAADFMNNPDNGNPRILRGVYDFAASWTDPSNGLRATHWTYQAVEGCGDTPDGGLVGWQEVATFDANDFLASRFIANAKGMVWIRIRDLTTPGDCFGARLVATGWGTLHYTDNDEIAWYPNSRNNIDAWTFRAEGTLTTPDGRTVRYSGHYHATWDPSTLAPRNEVFQVTVH